MTSQINPNDIDGNYPVAGQPNNTQGMRDNFTNTATNFQYAANEITELQTKGLFKSALTGTTLDNNMNNNLILAALVQDFSATAVAITATSGSVTVDYAAGHYQTVAPLGNISLNFTNWPASRSYGYVKLQVVVTDTSYTLELPAAVSLGTTGVQGYAANVITFATTGTYEFAFGTKDGGVTITVFDLNRPLSYYTNPVTINSNAASTNATSGALVVAGGVGISGNLYVTGNVVGTFVAQTQTFAGNVTAGNLITSGVVSAGGNVIGGNIRTAGQMSAAGNVTGSYFIGDGSQLTNIIAVAGASIVNGNSNVRVNANSNVTIGVRGTSNVAVWANTGGYITGLVSATGNITGGNINTAGVVSATGNINGGNINTAFISVTGNTNSGNVTSIGTITSGSDIIVGGSAGVNGALAIGGLIYANGNIGTSGSVNAVGNIAGSYFIGNGTFLTGLATSTKLVSGTTELAIEIPSGNIQATVGGTANVVVFTTGGLGVNGFVLATGNVTGNNITASGNVNVSGAISATGNLAVASIVAAGNIASGSIAVTGNVSLTANVIAGNLTTGSQVVALGNVTGGNIKTDGTVVALSATALPAGGTTGAGYLLSSVANFGVFFGSGAPTLSAAKGSLYLRSDGSTTTDRMYVNTNGSTTWTAVITAA